MLNFNFNLRRIFNNVNKKLMGKRYANTSRYIGEYEVINDENLRDFIKEDVFILDVRTQYEFKGIRVVGAINIPLMMLSREIVNIVPDKNTKILIYCSIGERTMLAIQKLNSLGYKDLYIWGNGGLNTLKCKDILEY